MSELIKFGTDGWRAIIGADFRLLKSCSDVLIIYSPPFLLAQQSN